MNARWILMLVFMAAVVCFMEVGVSGADEVDVTFAGRYNSVEGEDVAITGNYAYVASFNYGLKIIDISNPDSPVLAGSCSKGAIGVAVSGNYAYVADFNYGLKIFDVSNPNAPVLAGSYDVGKYTMSVAVSGGYAYVANREKGLFIIDISNPVAPVLTGSYDMTDGTSGVAVTGGYAYVTDLDNGLFIIDISNPAAPVLIGNYRTAGSVYDVSVSGGYAYLANRENGLVIIDISNPAAPVFIGSYDTAKSAVDVVVSGSYAYVADFADLVIIDVSNPAAPVLAGVYDMGKYANGVAVSGNYVYVADLDDGLVILRTDAYGTDMTPSISPTIMVSGTASDDTNVASVTDEIYDYSWFENNAELRIHATDLMIMRLEPYNDTAGDYFSILNKDIRDQVLFPILIEFGNIFTPMPFNYDQFQPDSVDTFNEITKANLISEGKLSSSEIVTVASYNRKAFEMLLWYKDAIENIEISGDREDAQDRAIANLDSGNMINELNYYKQLLVQERDYWVVANNVETLEDQEHAVDNAINIINQEKMMFRDTSDLSSSLRQHNFNEELDNYKGFYMTSIGFDGQVQTTRELLIKYKLKQQDYVNDFNSNNINLVASSLTVEDRPQITQTSTSTEQKTQEKTSVGTILSDAVNSIIEWFESLF